MQINPSFHSISNHPAPTPLISWFNRAVSTYTCPFNFKLYFELKERYEGSDYETVELHTGATLSEEISRSKGFLRHKHIIPSISNYDKLFDEYLDSNNAYESVTIKREVEKVKSVVNDFLITCNPMGDAAFFEDCLVLTSKTIIDAIDNPNLLEITANLETSISLEETTPLTEEYPTETSVLDASKQKKLVVEQKTYQEGKNTAETITLSHKSEGREIVSEIKKNTESCEFRDLIRESEIKYYIRKK
jgi:hypothetical protein